MLLRLCTKRFGTITQIHAEGDVGSVQIGTQRALAEGSAGIVNSTTIGGAGFYTLNGTYKDYTDIGGVLDFASAADDSGKTFIITGKDMLGNTISGILNRWKHYNCIY